MAIITATATIGGSPVPAIPAKVAVVMVTLDAPTITPGASPYPYTDSEACLTAKPGTWVTEHDPGSDWAAFKFSGAYDKAEEQEGVSSGGPDSDNPAHAWDASTQVTLTATKERPEAIGKIEVGFIQSAFGLGYSASYGRGTMNGTYGTLIRTGSAPNNQGEALDWIPLDQDTGEPYQDPENQPLAMVW